MLAATALVLMMTPALGLFYAGLVRAKNTLNTFMMSVAAIAVATVMWAAGRLLAGVRRGDGFVGGLGLRVLKASRSRRGRGRRFRSSLFFAFEAAFCIITVALVSGAVVERMRFGPLLVFSALWSVFVYAVLAHWVLGGGWLQAHGTLDFAGGVPVEMGSGFSALAAALVVGARKDYGRQALLPHNAMYVLLGAGLLWFGWFGFNGGSGYSTGHSSVLAFTNTLLAPACTLVVWFVLDLVRAAPGHGDRRGDGDHRRLRRASRRPAGYISPIWAMVLGAIAALPSYALIVWRPRTRLDETLDVLGGPRAGRPDRDPLHRLLRPAVVERRLRRAALRQCRPSSPGRRSPRSPRPAYAFAVTFVILRLLGAGDAAAGDRARAGARHGHRPARGGGLHDRRGRDPRVDRGSDRVSGRSGTALTDGLT